MQLPIAAPKANRSPLLALLAVVLAALMCSLAAPAAHAQSLTTSPLAVPPSGSLFGAFANPSGTTESASAVATLEGEANRPFDVNRVYVAWGTPLPSPYLEWEVSSGITPILSIETRTKSGTAIPWASIAAGTFDAAIITQANGLASMGVPILLSLDHEPELDPANGTAADFVAAWRHYVTVFRSQGVTNVSFVPILRSVTYRSSAIDAWYPGDSYVDWVGADGYNSYGCGSKVWTDFSTVFAGFNSFAVAHQKPAVIAEWGSPEDPNTPGRKAQWITDAATTLQGWPQVEASSYFDAAGKGACKWNLDSSASAMAAFASMGAQTWFNARPRIGLTPASSSGGAPLGVTFGVSAQGGLRPIANWQLDYGDGTTPAAGSGVPPTSLLHSYGPGTFTATLTVSDSASVYSYITASVTAYPPPSVIASAAYSTTPVSVALAAHVNPNAADTTYQFQLWTASAGGPSSPVTDIGAGSSSRYLNATLSGLHPATLYYWCITATNLAGTTVSPTQQFSTTGQAPGTTNLAATINGSTSVTLSGQVYPRGLATTWYFEYGTTSGYGVTIPIASAGSGTPPTPVSAGLSQLQPGTKYHYTLVATNQLGTTSGGDHTFVAP